jgi:hypothetical protein
MCATSSAGIPAATATVLCSHAVSATVLVASREHHDLLLDRAQARVFEQFGQNDVGLQRDGRPASTPNKLGMNPNSFPAVSRSSLDAGGTVSVVWTTNFIYRILLGSVQITSFSSTEFAADARQVTVRSEWR